MDKRETDVRRGRMKDDKELVHETEKKILHALEYKLKPLWNLRKQTTNSSLHFFIQINGSGKSQVLQR